MDWIRKALKYGPAIWAAMKIIWTLYKSKVKQDGYREALKDEQRKHVAAEARNELSDRLSGSGDERPRAPHSMAAARSPAMRRTSSIGVPGAPCGLNFWSRG